MNLKNKKNFNQIDRFQDVFQVRLSCAREGTNALVNVPPCVPANQTFHVHYSTDSLTIPSKLESSKSDSNIFYFT